MTRQLLILYATETGNAQDVADRIAFSCRSLLFKCHVINVDRYSSDNLINEELVIFVVSTTGSGVEPRSMTPLWNTLLTSNLPMDLFEDLFFATFGLGDTSYEKFCWPAKLLSKRLSSLGATEICERGEGDEQHPLGIDGALEPWLEKLRESILQLYPLSNELSIPISQPEIPPPRVTLQVVLPQKQTHHAVSPKISSSSIPATVTTNNRITAQDWYQDVRHLEFHTEEDIDYSPGDIAIIHPIVAADEVEEFFSAMGWENEADELLRIGQRYEDQSLPDDLPETFTLRTLFTHYLDFNAVPQRSLFQHLRNFTTDDMEREKLEEFLSKEGADELYDYCYRVRRTVREIIPEFRHVSIPKDYIFDVFPFLRPRQFSIASSIKKHPHEIHLCVAIVRYRTKLRIPRKGVCTSYLAQLKPGDKLQIQLQKGLFHLPPNPHTPIICIGPGTGIAPMRALIEERIHSGIQTNTLYFGCRSTNKDEHYSSEWSTYQSNDQLSYRVAHSRDGLEGIKRTYVQDLIEQDSSRIWKLLKNDKAWVYISGSSNKMPAGVKAALVHTAEIEGNLSTEDSKKYIELLSRESRLIEECWS